MKNNKLNRRQMLTAIGSAGAIAAAGCTEGDLNGEAGTGDDDSEMAEGDVMLQTAAGSPGGTGYVIMTSMLSTASSAHPDLGYNVLPGGWLGNNNRLQDQEVDMAHTTVVAATLAATGQDPYDEEDWDTPPSNIRSVINDQSEQFYYVLTQPDFPYDSLQEAADDEYPIEVMNQPDGTFGGFVWDTVLEEANYGQEQIEDYGGRFVRTEWDDAAEMFLDEDLDAILAVSGRSVGWLENITATREPRFLDWTEDDQEFFEDNYGLDPHTLEEGGLPGLERDLDTMIDGGHIATHVDVPDEAIEMFVSGVIEEAEQVPQTTDTLEMFEADEAMFDDTPFELHPGAEQAYEDAGLM